jgi:hypothetical protein
MPQISLQYLVSNNKNVVISDMVGAGFAVVN